MVSRLQTSPGPLRPDLETAPPLVLSRVALPDGRLADVALAGGVIRAVEPPGTLGGGGDAQDLAGYVVLPSLVEPHAHLDKAFTADVVPNPTGDLLGAIAAWLPARAGHQTPDIALRSAAVARRYLLAGTTAIRAHTDVGVGIGLRALDAIMQLRESLRGTVDIQVVALCSYPVTGVAGADNRALLADALAAGADLVGGAPAIDDDPTAALDYLAAQAFDGGLPLDLHIDETLDPASFTLKRMIDVAEGGSPQPLTASHAVSLGVQSEQTQRHTADRLAALGIGVVTLPQTNLFLQGRGLGAGSPRGLTAVRALLDAGVRLGAGGDNLQDPFNAMGRADPFETASLLVSAGHVLPGEAVAAITTGARAVMGLPEVSIDVGAPADLVALRAPSARGAVASGPAGRIVLRAGRVVARTTVEEWESGWR